MELAEIQKKESLKFYRILLFKDCLFYLTLCKSLTKKQY